MNSHVVKLRDVQAVIEIAVTGAAIVGAPQAAVRTHPKAPRLAF